MTSPSNGELLGVLVFADPEAPPARHFAGLPGFSASVVADGAPWTASASIDGTRATLEQWPYRFIPAPLIDHDPRLSEGDRAVVRAGRSSVRVTVSSATDDPFLARKSLVRVLGAALGKQGAAALDVTAQRIWTREALDDELSHDAPLDVDQMYTLHAVSSDAAVYWLHSHGLAELGAFDFDILAPHPSHATDSAGFVRAMALASIEGRLRPDAAPIRPSSLDLEVRGMEAEAFMRSAAPDDTRLRDERDHTDQRVVLCDPHAKLAPKWLAKPRPARIFQVEAPDDALVYYSSSASRRAADRARGTYGRMRAAAEELAALELPTLVKLGYEVDGGGPDDREHLWFEVHACHEQEVDATLVNRPFRVSHLRAGARAHHSVDRLSDWQILTPLGSITPRSLHVLRAIRADRPRVERVLAEHRERRRG